MRRATLAAFRPLATGAITTTEALERKVSDQDLERLERLAKELDYKGSSRLKKGVTKLRQFKPKPGVTLAEALAIDL